MHNSSKNLIPFLILSVVIVLSLACGGTNTVNPTSPAITQAVQSSQSGNQPQPTSPPQPTNTPKPTPIPPTPTPAPIGQSRSNPYPKTEIVTAPNWDIQVLDMVRGDAAWQAIQTTNQFNDPAPDGMEYLLVKIHAKCTYADSDEHSIGGSDFDLTGDHLVRYSQASVVEPDPALDAKLYTDGETEGWVSFAVGKGEGNLILIFDELMSFDENSSRFIALDEGASVIMSPELSEIMPTDLGKDRSAPAPFEDNIVTEDWQVNFLEVVRGEAAWTMVQAANQFNDPPADGMEYVVLRVHAKYIGTVDKTEQIDGSYFRTTGSANVVYDNPSVVDPEPAFDATLYPGGEAEGWVVLQVAQGETSVMAIFEPLFSFSGEDKRFIALEEGASVTVPPELSGIVPTDLGKDRSAPAPLGDIIVTEDWQINFLEVVSGDAAWTMVQAANQFNDPPADGMEYVAFRVHAKYIGTDDKTEQIDGSYFNTTGSANVVYDNPSVVDPEPAFDATLYPGGEVEGWVVLQVANGETGITAIFEPLFSFTSTDKRFMSLE
jgi:hypothetical protein